MSENRLKIFANIYENGVWGRIVGEKYHSGGGSETQATHQYRNFLSNFLQEHRENIDVIVEIGCGDFNVMSNVNIPSGIKYIGCDIYPNLIEENKRKFPHNNHQEFRVLDAVEESLPVGDLLVIKQVLQHLSNEDIQKILAKRSVYKYTLLTDGLPPSAHASSTRRNDDKPTDHLTRPGGLWLELPPFNLKAEVVLEYPISNGGEIFRTLLCRN